MAEEIDLTSIQSTSADEFEGDVIDLTSIESVPSTEFQGDVIDLTQSEQTAVGLPDVDRPSFPDLLKARAIFGVSSTLSNRPEDNLKNVQSFIPNAKLDASGNVLVPNPDTGNYEP